MVRGWGEMAVILVCDVVHEDGSTLRHSEQRIFLNLRIRRQNPLCKALNDGFGEVEVLKQVQQGCSARRRSSGELLRSRMGGRGGEGGQPTSMFKPSSSVGLAGGLGESSAAAETLLLRGGIVGAGEVCDWGDGLRWRLSADRRPQTHNWVTYAWERVVVEAWRRVTDGCTCFVVDTTFT